MAIVEILSILDKVIIQFSDRYSVIYTTEQLWEWVKNDTLSGVVDITSGHNSVVLSPYPGKRINYELVISHLNTITTKYQENTLQLNSVTIPVEYCGEDLSYILDFLQLSSEEFILWHTQTPWIVSFLGFMPGFAYMIRDQNEKNPLMIPRKKSPRTYVPAGSVALGGPYCGIYPLSSPGGWQIIGYTDIILWELGAKPPSLLSPGMKVHFIQQ